MRETDVERGVLLLDKPAGITSHAAVQKARRILGAERSGHTGTLDAGVTGLLVIGLGEGRKAISVMMGLDKEYEGTMNVHGEVSLADVRKVARGFVGIMTQLPPKRSRVVRKPRKRRVDIFSVTKKDGRLFSFRVKCEAGTYIRKLVHDLGEKLGTGAHMERLRRTSVGPFSVKGAVTFEKLKPSHVMPLERALEQVGLKSLDITEEDARKLSNGLPVENRGKDGKFGFHLNGEVMAIGFRKDNLLRTERVFNR